MTPLTNSDLERLSAMAKVPLPAGEQERARIIEKFQNVLEFVKEIESVEVPESTPHYYSNTNTTRGDYLLNKNPDSITESLAEKLVSKYNQVRDDIINLFPSRRGDKLVVPKVMNNKKAKN